MGTEDAIQTYSLPVLNSVITGMKCVEKVTFT